MRVQLHWPSVPYIASTQTYYMYSISGLHPSKTKLELQKHLATLDNQEQASVFENTMVCGLKLTNSYQFIRPNSKFFM